MTTVHAATATQKTVDGPSNKVRYHHRVGIECWAFPPVVGIGTRPPSHPQGECAPTPLVRGEGGYICLRVRGRGSPSSDETYTVVVYIYMYIVDIMYLCGNCLTFFDNEVWDSCSKIGLPCARRNILPSPQWAAWINKTHDILCS